MLRLFTKTYEKDLECLRMAITSVAKFTWEPIRWDIVIEEGHEKKVWEIIASINIPEMTEKPMLFKVHTLHVVPDAHHIKEGYMRQQWVKMNAHRFIQDALVWNWDSDVIALRKFNHLDFTSKQYGKAGKPLIWMTELNHMIIHGYPQARKDSLFDIFGNISGWEFMRCMPIAIHGGITSHAERSREWQRSFEALKRGDRRFSEFNVMGEYAFNHFKDEFDFRDTQHERTWGGSLNDAQAITHQYWSHGGVPNEIRDFISKL